MTLSMHTDQHSIQFARIALFAGLFAKSAGLALVVVLLPPLGRQLGFSDFQTGFVMSVSALAAILLAPVWGWLTDHWGRRPVLLIGFFALAGTIALLAVVISARLEAILPVMTGLIALLFVRITQTGFAAATIPSAQAYLADTTDRSQRVQGMGFMGAAFGLGAMLGAALAGTIGGTAPVTALLAAALIVLAGALMVFLFVFEPDHVSASKKITAAGLPCRRLLPNFLVTFLGVAMFSVLQQTTALRFQDYHGFEPVQSIEAAGGILAATSLAMIITQGIALRWLKWSPALIVRRAGFLGSVAFAGLLLAQGHLSVLLAMVLLGVGLGLLLPGNLASMSLKISETAQGKVAGVNAVFQGLGLAAGPLVGAYLNASSVYAVSVVGVMSCLVVAAIFWPRQQHND